MAASARPQPVAGVAPELTTRLRLLVARLARQLRQQADNGLSPTQLTALAAIERDGPMTLGSLAERERVAAPTITKVVDKLEQAGLVLRVVDPLDRRYVRVAVTAEGEALTEHIRNARDAWLATRLAALDPAERRRIADALDALEGLLEGDRP